MSELYEPKHHHRMTLSTYNGVMSGELTLNPQIADNFMRVADIRRNILIVDFPKSRTREYQGLGDVKVAKRRLEFPRLQFSIGNNIEAKGDDWLIKVDSQSLAEQINSTPQASDFRDQFSEQFKGKVTKGMVACLLNEKILNGGYRSMLFFYNYYSVARWLIMDNIYNTYESVLAGDDPMNIIISFVRRYLIEQSTQHIFNKGMSLMLSRRPLSLVVKNERTGISGLINYTPSQPFIRNTVVENMVAPLIPVDRLLRGLTHIIFNGDRLIGQR